MKTVYDSEFMLIEVDEQKKLLIDHWKPATKSMTSEQMRKEIEELARVTSLYKLKLHLADDSQNSYPYQIDEQEWVAQTVGGASALAGVQKFALVLPPDIIAGLATEQTADEANVPFDLKTFDNIEDAKEWLGV